VTNLDDSNNAPSNPNSIRQVQLIEQILDPLPPAQDPPAAYPDATPDQSLPKTLAVAFMPPAAPSVDNPLDPASYLQQTAAEFAASMADESSAKHAAEFNFAQAAVHGDDMAYLDEDDPPPLADQSEAESSDNDESFYDFVPSAALATVRISDQPPPSPSSLAATTADEHLAPPLFSQCPVRHALRDVQAVTVPAQHDRTEPSAQDTTKKK